MTENNVPRRGSDRREEREEKNKQTSKQKTIPGKPQLVACLLQVEDRICGLVIQRWDSFGTYT